MPGADIADAGVRETKERLDVGEDAARLVNVVRDIASAGVTKDDQEGKRMPTPIGRSEARST